jgi:hypothetical protein
MHGWVLLQMRKLRLVGCWILDRGKSRYEYRYSNLCFIPQLIMHDTVHTFVTFVGFWVRVRIAVQLRY